MKNYSICLNVCPCGQCDEDEEDCVLVKTYEKSVIKLAELIEPFGKFKCPSCDEMFDACYDEETGEPYLWFSFCPECGQAIATREDEKDARLD